MGKLSKILNLTQEESKKVYYLIIYSFFMGAAMAFFVTSSTSLFLSSFDREYLPVSFIVAGVIVWIIGLILASLQKKLQFTKSLPASLSFLVFSIVILLILFGLFKIGFIVFLLYAWIRVFAYIHAVAFWSLAGKLFTLRQAKRVFGLITGGEVIASILSFFSIPVLLNFIETTEILIFSGVFLFLGFIFFLIIVRKFKNLLSDKQKIGLKKVEKDSNRNLIKSKYYKLVFLIAFIPIFAQFFVDFIFQAQAKVEFPHREELTAFVGVFFGISAIVEFLLKTFLSGRILNQYGVKAGLLAFPIVLLISFLLASVFGLFFGAAGLFFSFVTLGRLFTRAVRTSFNDPSTQILFQPLPENQRLIIQNKIESGPKAYASIVAGIVLLLFAQIPNISLVFFAILLFAVTIFWIKFAIDAYKEYKTKIQDVLQDSIIESTDIPQKKVAELLTKTKYNSVGTNVIKQIMGVKTEVDNTKYKLSQLVEFANSNDFEKRIIAAHGLSIYSIYKTEKLYIKLLNDENFLVRCEAISAVGNNKHKELFESLIINFKTHTYRQAAYFALIKIGTAIIPNLIKAFYALDYDMPLQLKIIELLENVKSSSTVEFFRKLLTYHNRLIRERIFEALGNLNYNISRTEEIKFNLILEERINSFVYLSASILDIEKHEKCRLLIHSLEDRKNRQKKSIFLILSLIYDKNAINLIKNNLDIGDEKSNGFALEVADTVISELHKQLLIPLFESQTNAEITRKYKLDFPQEKLNLNDRLIDIVNADISITGSYVKVEAIKLLTEFNDLKTLNVLKTNVIHPLEYIREISAIILNTIDSSIFDAEVELNKNKIRFLNKLHSKVNLKSKSGNMFIFEKLELIESLPMFEILTFPEIYSIATKSQELSTKDSEIFEADFTDYQKVYIIISGKLEYKEKIYERSDVLSIFLTENNNKIIFNVSEPTFILETTLDIFSDIIINNFEFTKKLIDNSIEKCII